jgi:hypothetical protein
MLRGRRVHMCLEALYERRTLARDVFLLVVFVFCVAALWTQQYSATAIVELTPQSSPSEGRPRPSALSLVQNALTDGRLGAIIEKMQLYPKMVQARGDGSVIRYMRSKISLGAITPSPLGPPRRVHMHQMRCAFPTLARTGRQPSKWPMHSRKA